MTSVERNVMKKYEGLSMVVCNLYSQSRIMRCHCMSQGSLHVQGALGSLSWSHISFKLILNGLCERFILHMYSIKCTSMFSMYLKSGDHRHFNRRFITVLTYNPTVFMFVYINAGIRIFVMFSRQGNMSGLYLIISNTYIDHTIYI